MPSYKLQTLEQILDGQFFLYTCYYCNKPFDAKQICISHMKHCHDNPSEACYFDLDEVIDDDGRTIRSLLYDTSTRIKLVKHLQETHVLAGYEHYSIQQLVDNIAERLLKLDPEFYSPKYFAMTIILSFFNLSEDERKQLFTIGCDSMLTKFNKT